MLARRWRLPEQARSVLSGRFLLFQRLSWNWQASIVMLDMFLIHRRAPL